MKKLFLSTLLMALPLLASAYDCLVDGIYYNLIPKGNMAEVTYQKVENGYPYSDYSGSVVIPEKFTYEGVEYSVTTIGRYAFYGCIGLTSMTIGNSVTSIGDYAFYFCSRLTSVTIPNSVTTIGDYAFSICSGLTSIKVESGNTTYDSRNDCNAIIETASNTLVTGCKNTIIPNSVTTIREYAFYYCSDLTSLTIPNSVTSIGDYAFQYCSGLTSVTIPNSVTSIGNGAFSGCTGLTSMTIGNSVTSIGNWAFGGCIGLTSVTIPNSVTTIREYAFSGCTGLTSLTIGNSVTSIGGGAFYGCVGLTTVISEVEIPCSIDENCFSEDVFKNSTLYVPKGTVDKYKSTDYWSKFVFIEESDPTDIIQVSSDDLLISAHEGKITVNSEAEGLTVNAYSMDGKALGSGVIRNGKATIQTNQPSGESFIVKAGNRSVKMLMK